MKTIIKVSQLDTTIVLTDKSPKHQYECQGSVRLTAKYKINIQSRVEAEENKFMKLANIERKKDKKTAFFNKHKSNK